MTHAGTRGWGDPSTSTYRKKIIPIVVDQTKFFVHKDVASIFHHFLVRLVLENNYSLDEAEDDWSYVFRPVRGYEDEYRRTGDMRYLSNHSWGLAIDVNALKNPMSSRLKTDLPVEWIKANAGRYGLAWGGSYSGRKDPMHFEFMGTPKKAKAILDSLNSQEGDDLTADQARKLDEVHSWLRQLTAPRTPDKSDVDPSKLSLADIYTAIEKHNSNA